jgi:hypothetical protein
MIHREPASNQGYSGRVEGGPGLFVIQGLSDHGTETHDRPVSLDSGERCEKCGGTTLFRSQKLNVSGMRKGEANREKKGASGSKIKMGWAKTGRLRPPSQRRCP